MVFLINFAKILIYIYFLERIVNALHTLGWASFKAGLFWTVFLVLKKIRILTNSDNMKILTAAQRAGI